MNSTVGPIFNENFVEKEVCGSCEQCARPTGTQLTLFSKKKKKKLEMLDMKSRRGIQMDTKGYCVMQSRVSLVLVLSFSFLCTVFKNNINSHTFLLFKYFQVTNILQNTFITKKFSQKLNK